MLSGVASAVLDWLTGGSALAALGKVSLALCAVVFGLIYRRYLGILGANRRVPAERHAYDALRASLAEGNLAAQLYARSLSSFLDAVDRLFADAGLADRTLFPHAFGLRTPAPLWTAPAFDRCLLLALFYPIAMIFVIWAVSGNIGSAETALHLKPELLGWQRSLAVAGVVFCIFILSRPTLRQRWGAVVVITIFAIGIIINSTVVVFVLIVAFLLAFTGAPSGALMGAQIVIFAVGAMIVSSVGAVAWIVSLVLLTALRSSYVARYVERSGAVTTMRRLQGVFLSLFSPVMTLICIGAADFLSPLNKWEEAGPTLLFLGLLTVLNAPFAWFSLGVTRALLRRGLELGGWWPYALALVDATLATVIIAALALTMLVGVQAFDALAKHGGGAPVLPLDVLVDGITSHPVAPEYWWLYALLLSAMIPSLINLVIGGTSLLRGLPGLPLLLLRSIPTRSNVPKFDRAWIAAVLTGQIAAGAALGIAAQVFLVWVIVGYVMPFFGLELLSMARGLADFNLPARVGQLFAVSL